jgi:hypothetical protein
MRLSLKESRMKMLNATNLDRKSGIRGPKTTGRSPPSKVCLFFFPGVSRGSRNFPTKD